LGLGVTALILAGIEYMNRVDQEKWITCLKKLVYR
jgi:hypothetical protein